MRFGTDYSQAMALQLTPALEQRLEHLAAESRSSLDELAREALEEFCTTREELIAAGLERAAAGSAGERLEGVRRERMRAAGAIMATTHAKTRASGSMGFCDTRCP